MERTKEIAIAAHSDYLSATIADIKIGIESGLLYPSFINMARSVLDYSGILTPKNFDLSRYIMRGNIASILPADYTVKEKLLAERLTEQAAESYRILKLEQSLKLHKGQPLTTIFMRTCAQVKQIAVPERPQLAGVISLTRPLLFNTFNLEAANFALKVYGHHIGLKIQQFSYEHELGHQAYASHIAKVSLEKNESNTPASLTAWYKIRKYNEIMWEVIANQLPAKNPNLKVKGIPVFPNYIAHQHESYGFSGMDIVISGEFETFSGKHTSFYRDGMVYPFCMDPADAQEYLAVYEYLGIQN